jgi:flagellar motor switch protein FliN/FliY
MSDGSLSQDEIDALLQETESLEIDSGFGGSEPLSEEEKSRFVALLEGVIDSQASNLSILTRKNVNLERPTLDLVMGEDIIDQLPDEVVDVKIDFTDALPGEHSYLVDSGTAQAVAGLMMGQGGVELDDAALSAVAEALSQISGPVATEIGNQSGKTVQNAPPDFQSVTKDKVRLPQGEVVVKLEYPLMIEGENPAKLVELYSLSLAKEIITATGADAAEAGAAAGAASHAAAAGAFGAAAGPSGGGAPQASGAQAGIAQTFGQAFGAPQGLGMGSGQAPPNVQPVQFANLQAAGAAGEQGNIGLLMDVYMELTVELGRTRKLIREILGIGEGTIIELDKLAGEPVDILVNHKLIAKGEVVVIDENFGVRVTEIVSPMQRMSDLT